MTRSDFDQLCIDWTITLGVYIVEAARTGGLLSLMELGQLSSRQREMLRSQKFIESEAYVRLNVARRLMYSALDSIPDVEVTEEEKLRNAEPVSARFAQAPEGLSKVILVVEDEDSVRKFARRVLEASGYVVLESRNGQEGLTVCETHPGPINLLVSDVVMPDLGGKELAERASTIRPDMKVLFMSGHSQNFILQKGINQGVPFLLKPFTPIELAHKVKEALDTHSGQ